MNKKKKDADDLKLIQCQQMQDSEVADNTSERSWNSTDSRQFPARQKQAEADIQKFKKEMFKDNKDREDEFKDKVVDVSVKLDPIRWAKMTEAFKTLAVQREDSKYLSIYRVTEESIIDNFAKLFGYSCDIFARILYLRMAKNKDSAKIDFVRFSSIFLAFLDDIKENRNRAFFEILDLNGTGKLSIMFLMQIVNDVDRDTLFGQEILKIVREYKEKNIMLREGYRRRIVLNFATFNALVPNSALIKELQYRIFGEYVPAPPPTEPRDAWSYSKPPGPPAPKPSPFEHIPDYEKTLKLELAAKSKVVIVSDQDRGSLCDTIMAADQFAKIKATVAKDLTVDFKFAKIYDKFKDQNEQDKDAELLAKKMFWYKNMDIQ